MRNWIAPGLAIVAAGLLPGAFAADEGPAALPFEPSPGQGVLLIIADIHFDPFADPAIVDQLVAAGVGAWPGIFASAGRRGFAQYGNDANYPLMMSALEAAAACCRNRILSSMPATTWRTSSRPGSRPMPAAGPRHTRAS